jgi:hypothetical protein
MTLAIDGFWLNALVGAFALFTLVKTWLVICMYLTRDDEVPPSQPSFPGFVMMARPEPGEVAPEPKSGTSDPKPSTGHYL